MLSRRPVQVDVGKGKLGGAVVVTVLDLRVVLGGAVVLVVVFLVLLVVLWVDEVVVLWVDDVVVLWVVVEILWVEVVGG